MTIFVETSIRKVKILQGRAKEQAEKMQLKPDDLVIVRTKVNTENPLPEYQLEKIEGNPMKYLLSHKSNPIKVDRCKE